VGFHTVGRIKLVGDIRALLEHDGEISTILTGVYNTDCVIHWHILVGRI
jgi:hypothetical protein